MRSAARAWLLDVSSRIPSAISVAVAAGALTERSFWVRLHRYAGLVMALFLILTGVTGALLAFNDELDGALNPGMMYADTEGLQRLSPSELARRVERELQGAKVTGVSLTNEAGRSTRILADLPAEVESQEVYADPVTGRVLGTREWGAFKVDAPHLMPFIFKLHYDMHLGSWGEFVLGLVALIWLLDCFVGAYLTLPAKTRGAGLSTFWRRWQTAWQVRRGSSPFRLNFDLHRASGLWLWGVLAILALTSVYFNLKQQVFMPVVSIFGTVSPPLGAYLPGSPRPERSQNKIVGFDAAVRAARDVIPARFQSFRPYFVSHNPAMAGYVVFFETPNYGKGAFDVQMATVLIDDRAGTVKGFESYDSGTAVDKFIALQYPLHSGKILGLPGRILICIAGLATALLSITGIYIWLIKRRARRART